MMKNSDMNLRVLYSDDFTELEKEELLSAKIKINFLYIDEMLYTSTGFFIFSINGSISFGKNEKDILQELTRIFDALYKISDVQWSNNEK
jgi:hypothetical protein